MHKLIQTRRGFLQRITALCIAGLTTTLHSSMTFAASVSQGLGKIKGLIINKSDVNYAMWRASMSWYIFKPERYPDSIIRAANEEDVVEAINYARDKGIKIALRSSGHNPARAVLRDEGILLDLSQLRDVEIDVESLTAWIQPGIKAEELLHLTTEQGLAFPAAHTGIVGLGGYLAGGGIGWNMPEYDIACRSILAAEIITADGKKVLASRDENQELHWAIRGAGPGFFAAVVRYKIQLYPLHTAITMNSYVIPIDKMMEALDVFKEIGDKCDKRLEIFIKVGRFHPAEKPYAERDLVCTVGFFAFADSRQDMEKLMLPVTQSKVAELSIRKKEFVPLSYEHLYRPPETDYSSPNRTIVANIWTDDPGQSLALLTEKMQADPPPSPRSFLLVGWSFNPQLDDPSSCIRTAARHYMSWYLIAEKEQDNAVNYRWMDESVELVQPLTRGHYINEIDTLRYPQQIQECFSKESWAQLGQLRKKYDPDGVFHNYLGLG